MFALSVDNGDHAATKGIRDEEPNDRSFLHNDNITHSEKPAPAAMRSKIPGTFHSDRSHHA
jgi:hypothetical protein